MWQGFDVVHLAQQAAILSAVAFLPVLLLGAWHPRRGRLVPLVALLAGAVGASLVVLTVSTSARVWMGDDLPYKPFKIGPSSLGLRDLILVTVIGGWVPVGVAGAWILWRRRKGPREQVIPLVSCAIWVSAILLGAVRLCEYDHEDTVIAAGFSRTGWNRVAAGMTKAEVYRLIGPPLVEPLAPQLADGGECWARSWSAGYYAALAFEQGRVRDKRLWYSD